MMKTFIATIVISIILGFVQGRFMLVASHLSEARVLKVQSDTGQSESCTVLVMCLINIPVLIGQIEFPKFLQVTT